MFSVKGPANITSPPDFIVHHCSYDGGEYTVPTSYCIVCSHLSIALMGVTIPLSYIPHVFAKDIDVGAATRRYYYTAVVYTTCLHQSFDVIAAMSKRLLYPFSIYNILPP